jgi:hypothetical protein
LADFLAYSQLLSISIQTIKANLIWQLSTPSNFSKRMNTEQVLINLLLCGLLGLIGQGIRVIVGLKKLHEEAVDQTTLALPEAGSQTTKAVYDDLFDARKLWLSLFIGFMAGCLASLARTDTEFTREVQLAIIAAGYSGTDFIEGIFKKLLPGS